MPTSFSLFACACDKNSSFKNRSSFCAVSMLSSSTSFFTFSSFTRAFVSSVRCFDLTRLLLTACNFTHKSRKYWNQQFLERKKWFECWINVRICDWPDYCDLVSFDILRRPNRHYFALSLLFFSEAYCASKSIKYGERKKTFTHFLLLIVGTRAINTIVIVVDFVYFDAPIYFSTFTRCCKNLLWPMLANLDSSTVR